MKWIHILTLALIFNSCSLFESQEEKEKKIAIKKEVFEKKVQETREIQLKKLSAQTDIELAILKSKKELAEIEKKQLHLRSNQVIRSTTSNKKSRIRRVSPQTSSA